MRISVEPSADPAAYRFSHSLRVRFGETDAMGIAHHGSYLLYLEEARVEYLRAIGHPYDVMREEGFDLPVVEVWVGYRKPLRFDERVDIGVCLAEAGRVSLQLAYCLSVSGVVRATGVTVHGCSDRHGRARRMPSWVRELGEGSSSE